MSLVNMTEMLREAARKGYAVGNFDVFNVEMTKGVMAAAERVKSPVILAFADVFEVFVPMEQYAAYARTVAEDAGVPVALHLDHASNVGLIRRALDCGFTAVMIDASDRPLQENIAVTVQVKAECEKYGATLESEIGHVAGLEADYASDAFDELSIYTDVEEARLFARETGVDALAVSIGTVHGVYAAEPKLNIKRLRELKAALGIPLVLHGASGLSDDDLVNCVKNGIAKINIHTDLVMAAVNCVNEGEDGAANYIGKCGAIAAAVEKVAENRMRVCGSAGRA